MCEYEDRTNSGYNIFEPGNFSPSAPTVEPFSKNQPREISSDFILIITVNRYTKKNKTMKQ